MIMFPPIASDPLHSCVNQEATGNCLPFYLTGCSSPFHSGPRTSPNLVPLPRPDGAGAFLLIAEIHAIGSLGASRYLERRLPYLHAATGGRPFSMVIGCRYDETSKSVLDVHPMAGLLLRQEA
jgi:hypothetical protein